MKGPQGADGWGDVKAEEATGLCAPLGEGRLGAVRSAIESQATKPHCAWEDAQ